ncbi:MAG: hypothetical protein IKN15_01710 [Bacteroidaceae bacterium]|nr:hypothetical protein [Bacteroidaceae bacterium]
MSKFLDDLLKKMKTAPHVGVPQVTNPKLPTKVEKATAEYVARQKAMPNFKFGNGHPSPIYADPKFRRPELFIQNTVLTKEEREKFEDKYQAYAKKLKAETAKKKKESEQDVFESQYQAYAKKLREENAQLNQDTEASTNGNKQAEV